MKLTTIKALTGIAALAFAGIASAQQSGLDYNYVQAGYSRVNIDAPVPNDLTELDGASLAASARLTDNLFFTGGARTVESDKFAGIKTELEDLYAGIGFRYGINSNTDLTASALVVRGKLSLSTGYWWAQESETETKAGLDLGFRTLLSPQFELAGNVRYSEVFETTGEINGIFRLNRQTSLFAGYFVGDDIDGWNVGLRLSF